MTLPAAEFAPLPEEETGGRSVGGVGRPAPNEAVVQLARGFSQLTLAARRADTKSRERNILEHFRPRFRARQRSHPMKITTPFHANTLRSRFRTEKRPFSTLFGVGAKINVPLTGSRFALPVVSPRPMGAAFAHVTSVTSCDIRCHFSCCRASRKPRCDAPN